MLTVSSYLGRPVKSIKIGTAAVLLLLNSIFVFGEDTPNSADARQVAMTVGRLLEQGHYSRQKLDGEMSKRILETYLEDLDYNKLFFTQEDVDQFTQNYGSNLGDRILIGDLQPAREMESVFRLRVEERMAKVRRLLKKGIYFQEQQDGRPEPAR